MVRLLVTSISLLLLFGFEWGSRTDTIVDALRTGTQAEQREAIESLAHAPRTHPAWQVAFALYDSELLALALRHYARVAIDDDAPTLTAFASHPEPEVRAATLFAWERIRPAGSAALLIRAMSDSDARVRAQAARSLAGHHSDDVVRALEAGLDDPDERVRTAAIESLGKSDNELKLRALRKAAADAEPKLRSAALRALARTDGNAGLLYQGIQDRDNTVRAAAVAALGASRDPAAVNLLATIVDEDSATNARLALEALLYHESPAATDALLERIEGIIRHGLISETATALPHLSADAQARWRSKLSESLQAGSNPSAHTTLLVAMARVRPQDISEAEGALLDLANRTGDSQLDALRLLGSCRSDRALVSLVRAIGSDDAAIRKEALAGLADFQELNPQDQRIADGLLEALQEADVKARPAIIERIGATGASPLAPRLLPLLDLQQPQVLLATLKALANMPHRRNAPKLRSLLLHSHAKVRWAAAIALGAAGTDSDREWLQEQLDSDSPWDRAALLVALREIVERLGPDDETHETLVSFARGEQENLAALAAMTLSHLETTRGIAALRSLLTHSSPIRRALAATHLASADDPESRKALRARASDRTERSNVRIAALSALAMRASHVREVPRYESPWSVRLASACAQTFVRKMNSQANLTRRRLIAMPPTSNAPLRNVLRAIRYKDGRTLWVTTDALGEIHLWNVPDGPVELFDPVATPTDCLANE